MTQQKGPPVVTFLIILFLFGTIMSSLAAVTLLFPDSSLNVIWEINPRGYEGFQRIGNWSFLVLLSVLIACAACAVGLWFKKAWGYWMAICLLIMNLLGDVVNVFFLKEYRAAIGVPIVTVLLWLMFRPKTKKLFSVK
jgi:hypothetical protein